jgi:hypothetical protein
MESNLDMLGVAGKLVNYVVHLSKRCNLEKHVFLFTGCPNNKQLGFGLKKF